MRKVLVFGAFDGMHEGHRAFLRQAREYGDYLVVAVAPDAIVRQLKKKTPQKNIEQRIEALEAEALADVIVAGDEELGSYDVIKHHHPHVVALGYDQRELLKDLEERLGEMLGARSLYVEFVALHPHKPKHYHSSLLKKS